jgi:hypothetical protein
MHAWIDGWMDGWMYGCMDGWMEYFFKTTVIIPSDLICDS